MFTAGIELFFGFVAGALILIAITVAIKNVPALARAFFKTIKGQGSTGATVALVLALVATVTVVIWIANGTIH